MDVYPAALRETPRPLVALVGFSAIHAALEKCSRTQSPNDGVGFLSFKSSSSLPIGKKKEKRTSLDVSSGILKANWLEKHRNVVPACVCVLLKWDDEKSWRAQENDQVHEIDALKRQLRPRGIKLLVVIVHPAPGSFGEGVVTGTAAWEDKLSNVRRRTELDSKQVVSLSRDGPSSGGISEAGWLRVERLVVELAQQHYKDAAGRLKRDPPLPSTGASSGSVSVTGNSSAVAAASVAMLVRQHFKMAYYAELRREPRAALKYYNSAYQYVKELVAADARTDPRGTSRLSELRVVAEYIHVRTVAVYLASAAAPSSSSSAAAAVTPATAAAAAGPAVAAAAGGGAVADAVTQFGQHVRTFSASLGPLGDEWAHWAWLARQHEVFAEMLDERTPATVAAAMPSSAKLAYHLPVYHWLQAARFQQLRRRAAQRTLEPLRETLQSRFPPGWLESAAAGQEPVFVGIEPAVLPAELVGPASAAHPLEPSAASTADSPRRAAADADTMQQQRQARELHALASLSDTVLRLLAQASANAGSTPHAVGAQQTPAGATAGVSRLAAYIGTLQADEHEQSGQTARAKHLVDRLLRSYERDGWHLPLAHVLRVGRRCASRMQLSGELLDYSVLLLDPKLDGVNAAERAELQRDILRLLQDDVDSTLAEGRAMRMTATQQHVSLAVRFETACLLAPGLVQLHVRLRSHLPLPLQAHSLRLRFNHSAYDCTVLHQSADAEESEAAFSARQFIGNLDLLPGQLRECTVVLDVGALDGVAVPVADRNLLRCNEARLSVGDHPPRQLHLDWDNLSDAVESDVVGRGWEARRTMRVSPSAPQVELSVTHCAPALYHELHRVRFALRNRGSQPLGSGGQLSVQLLSALSGTSSASASLPPVAAGGVFEIQSTGEIGQPPPFPVPALAPGEETTIETVVAVGGAPGVRRLAARVDYDLHPSLPPPVSLPQPNTSVERVTELAVQAPFVASFMCFSSSYLPTSTVNGGLQVNQPFFLCMELQCSTPFPVVVHRVDLHLMESAKRGPPMAMCISSSTAESSATTPSLPVVESDKPVVLGEETKYAVWYELQPLVHGERLELGHVTIVWSRHKTGQLPPLGLGEESEGQAVSISIPMPVLNIQMAPLSATVEVPSFAVVGTVMPLSVTVHNHTDLLQELTLNVHDTAAFLFSGDKRLAFSVFPHSDHRFRYHLLPLVGTELPVSWMSKCFFLVFSRFPT
eukprot:TRINITY_DN1937_c0_g1_i2.p1 TRINITY_DN1937_c0_g1~~TRINITY_DN1937_c0_g1_i2.p1  ORF type:complete len:1217 (+),score=224.88 TRINITY_DN1937_c0_g1_i2:112-3762(+)